MRGVNKVIIVGNCGSDPEVKQFANGQPVPPAYQNNPQFAPQNPNQQQPQFQNNMQGEPKPSAVYDDIAFSALNGQLAHLI